MAQTVNDELLDSLVRHQIYLLRYSATVRNRINVLLNKTEKDIAATIRARMTKRGYNKASVAALKQTMREIKAFRFQSFDQIDEYWVREMVDLASNEPLFVRGQIQIVSPVVLNMRLPSAELLRAIVESRPFQGRTLKEWADGIRRQDIRRIEDQLKIGMVEGEGVDQLTRRIVGTARLKGADGVTQITRRDAASLARTAVMDISSTARDQFFEENRDIIFKEVFVATLDSNTTPICRSLDGKQYDVNQGPKPTLHFGCRSTRVPTLDGQVLGERPMKPVTEKMLLREYTKAEGLKPTLQRKNLPRGHKGSFDAFSRKRVRELTGRVPAKTTYADFLKRQSVDFQNDVLGKARGKLFRDGGLGLDKFVDFKGKQIRLDQLAKTHADAFKAAGLDPEKNL